MSDIQGRILWRDAKASPQPGIRFLNSLRSAVSADFRERNAVADILRRSGVPFVEGATTAKEHTLGLLKLAAEVEHALLVQYLYASISITGFQGTTEDPQRKQRNIAIQEMGHLATVQNLLLLVGGRDSLHLQRDVLREGSEQNPLPLLLEPLSHLSLAKYVTAERPAVIPSAQEKEVAALEQEAEAKVGRAIPRVGAIYAVLKWIFLPPEQADAWLKLGDIVTLPPGLGHLTDADLTVTADIDPYEARGLEWNAADPGFILQTPRTGADAVRSIELIAAQGEGVGATSHSHFESFLELVASEVAGQITVAAIATAPTVASITDDYTHLWGQVFAIQYQLLIFSVLHALHTARDPAGGLRSGLIDLAMRAMRRIILSLAGLLISLPQRIGELALAGPPFDLDPALLDIAPGDDLASRHRSLLDQLAAIYAAIHAHPKFASRPDDAIMLTNLQNFDQRRRALFP